MRFATVDLIQGGTNWYVYCNNNPLNRTDPTGLHSPNIFDIIMLPFKAIGSNFSKRAETKNREVYDADGSRGPGGSIESNLHLLTEGDFNVKAEAGVFDGKDNLFSFEDKSGNFGIKVESHLDVLSADGSLGIEGNGGAAKVSASILEIGLELSFKAFGKELSIRDEILSGSVAFGGEINPSEGSIGLKGAFSAGASVSAQLDGDPESYLDQPEGNGDS